MKTSTVGTTPERARPDQSPVDARGLDTSRRGRVVSRADGSTEASQRATVASPSALPPKWFGCSPLERGVPDGPRLLCTTPGHAHCVACGCPLTVLGGDPPRLYCVACVERDRAEVLPSVGLLAEHRAPAGELSDLPPSTPSRRRKRPSTSHMVVKRRGPRPYTSPRPPGHSPRR